MNNIFKRHIGNIRGRAIRSRCIYLRNPLPLVNLRSLKGINLNVDMNL